MIHVPIYILSALESQESIFKYLPPNGYHWQGLKSARVAQRIWLILTRPSPGEKPWLKSGRYTEAVSCIPLPEHFFSRKKRIGRQPRRELRQINYAWSWEIADIGSRVYSGSCVLEAMCVVPCKSVLIRVSTRSWLSLEQKEPFMPCHDFVPRFRWTVEYARYRARSCVSIFETMVNNGHSNFNFEMIRNFKTVKISNGDFRIYIFSSFRAIGNEFQSVTMSDWILLPVLDAKCE